MAQEFTLHIDIQNIPSETSKAKEKLNQVNGIEKKEPSSNSTTENLLNAAKAVGVVKLAKTVVSAGTSYLNYRATTVGARYGDTARQNEINNVMNTIGMVSGIGSATVAGAMAGSIVPGVGTAVGAAIGAVTGMVGQVVDIVKNIENWNMKNTKNTFEENRRSERLGLMKTDRNR